MSLRDELIRYNSCEIRPVEVDPSDAERTAGAIYSSKIINFNADDTLDFAIPTYMGEKVDLQRNTRYSFLFIREQSMKTAHGVFLQRIRIDNVPMAKIKLVTPLIKIQRRDYFRIGCQIDMKFQIVRLQALDFQKPEYMDLVLERIDDSSWNEGRIVDISGGGIKFLSGAPIMDLPFIYIGFTLPVGDKQIQVYITGKILSRQPIPRSLMCTYRVKFEPEFSRAQDSILAYVFEQQRLLVREEQP